MKTVCFSPSLRSPIHVDSSDLFGVETPRGKACLLGLCQACQTSPPSIAKHARDCEPCVSSSRLFLEGLAEGSCTNRYYYG